MHPTIVQDNFFDNVDEIIKLSKTLKFYKPDKKVNWFGLRTKSLHEYNFVLFKNIVFKILNLYYPNSKLSFTNTRVCFTKQTYKDKCKNKWHRDADCKIAAVIYLSEGNITGGTTIFDNSNKKQVIVGNTFNSMVAYDGNKLHGFTSLLNFKNKERLTLNVFIGNIKNET
tara:strand:- start:124 stop:633 length:510 start_codon:yes stop_codon:yes gene_type:complete